MRYRRLGERNVTATVALAAVVLSLAAFVIQGTVRTTAAADEQRAALALDLHFADARTAVSMQEVHLRHYEVSPDEAHREQFGAAARTAVAALTAVVGGEQAQIRQDALRLRAEQIAYQAAANRMMALILVNERTERREGGPPPHVRVDREVVTPAFYTLLTDVEQVFRTYHATAQRAAVAQRQMQTRQLLGTAIGFAVALVLIAMILRRVVGHQRRLVAHAAESRHQALHDPLTGLPNRAMFTQALTEALDAAVAGGHQTALMIVDLDGFKQVNDTWGHQAGDEVLLEAGRRLTAGTAGAGLVARLGGDEFAVLLPRVADLTEAVAVGDRLAAELRREFLVGDGPAGISGSLGIALGPRHGTGDELFRYADAAMYRAKSHGGGVATADDPADRLRVLHV